MVTPFEFHARNYVVTLLVLLIRHFLASDANPVPWVGGSVGVASGPEFVAALAHQQVTTIVLIQDVILAANDFAGYPSPLPLLRNITVTGASQDRYATLNFSWLKNKVRSANGTAVTVQYIVLAEFNEQSAQAPGVDLFAPLAPGETALLVMRHGAMVTAYCFPESLASAISAAYERPAFLPGSNAFLATSPPPTDPCVPDPAAPPLQRCWAHVGRHVDFSGAVSYVDAVGKSVPNGYYSHLVDVYVLCENQVSDECVQAYGPLGCMLRATSAALQPPPPPALPYVTSDATRPPAVPAAAGGGVAAAGGSGGGGGGHALTVGMAVGAGVPALLATVAAAAFVVRRRTAAAAYLPSYAPDAKSCKRLHPFWRGGRSGSAGRKAVHADSARSMAAGTGKRCRCSSPGGSELGASAGGACGGARCGKCSCGGGTDGCGAQSCGGGGGGGAPSSALCGESCGSALDSAGASSDATVPSQRRLRPQQLPPLLEPAAGAAAGQRQGPVLESNPGWPGGAPTSADGAEGPDGCEADPGCVVVTHRTPRRPDVQVGPDAAAEVRLLPVVRGRGSFGRVYEGLYGGQRVAVKVLTEAALAAAEYDGADGADVPAPLEAGALLPVEQLDGGGGAAAVDAAAGGAGAAARRRQVVALAQEVEVLGRCRHPNVVRLLAACLGPPRCCLVLELCETNLEGLMDAAPGRRLPMHTVLGIALDVARALEYLHPTIVHRDLKPANVLINGAASPRPVAKLSDFGLSRLRHTVRSTAHPCAGTPAYIAPECYDVSTRVVLHHSDMYSFGTLLWTMLSGREPWGDLSVMAIAYKVAARGERPPLSALPPGRCPPRLGALIRACWDADPRRRPAAAEAAKELAALAQELSCLGPDGIDRAAGAPLPRSHGSPGGPVHYNGAPAAAGNDGDAAAARGGGGGAAAGLGPLQPADLVSGAAAELPYDFLHGAVKDYSVAMLSGMDFDRGDGGGCAAAAGDDECRPNSTLDLDDMPLVRWTDPLGHSPAPVAPEPAVLQLGALAEAEQAADAATRHDAAVASDAAAAAGAVDGNETEAAAGGGDGGGGGGLLQDSILRELGVIVLQGPPETPSTAGGAQPAAAAAVSQKLTPPPAAARPRLPSGQRSGSAGLLLRRAAAAGAAGFTRSASGSGGTGSVGGGWGGGGAGITGSRSSGWVSRGGRGYGWRPPAAAGATITEPRGGGSASTSLPVLGSQRMAGPGGVADPGVYASPGVSSSTLLVECLELGPGFGSGSGSGSGSWVGLRRGRLSGSGSRRDGRLARFPELEPVPEAPGWG